MMKQDVTKVIRLSSKCRGKICVLDAKTISILRNALGTNIDEQGTMRNEHGALNNVKNLMGIYMLSVRVGGAEVLVLFYRTISTLEDVEQQLKIGGFRGLLEHAASIICNETEYIGHHYTGTMLKKALLQGVNPTVWPLISNDSHDLAPLTNVYIMDKTKSRVHFLYYNWRSLTARAAIQLRKGQFQIKMPNGVHCTITKGNDESYLLAFTVQGVLIKVEYSRIEKIRQVFDCLLSNRVPPWHIKNISIMGKQYHPESAIGRGIRSAVFQNINPAVQVVTASQKQTQ